MNQLHQSGEKITVSSKNSVTALNTIEQTSPSVSSQKVTVILQVSNIVQKASAETPMAVEEPLTKVPLESVEYMTGNTALEKSEGVVKEAGEVQSKEEIIDPKIKDISRTKEVSDLTIEENMKLYTPNLNSTPRREHSTQKKLCSIKHHRSARRTRKNGDGISDTKI